MPKEHTQKVGRKTSNIEIGDALNWGPCVQLTMGDPPCLMSSRLMAGITDISVRDWTWMRASHSLLIVVVGWITSRTSRQYPEHLSSIRIFDIVVTTWGIHWTVDVGSTCLLGHTWPYNDPHWAFIPHDHWLYIRRTQNCRSCQGCTVSTIKTSQCQLVTMGTQSTVTC